MAQSYAQTYISIVHKLYLWETEVVYCLNFLNFDSVMLHIHPRFIFPKILKTAKTAPLEYTIHWMKMKIIKLTGIKTKQNCKRFHQDCIISKKLTWKYPVLHCNFPSFRAFSVSRRHRKALFIRVPSKTVGKRPFLISCHLGFPLSPVFCQTSKSICR